MTTTVVHCKKEPYDVYIGRPSMWGNPYSHKEGTSAKYKVATVEEAISAYRKWLMNRYYNGEITTEQLASLYGKRLGCWCAPGPCHGDVLKDAAEWAKGAM